jgi:hypothetical protein
MAAPAYAKQYNFPAIFRGDTLKIPELNFDFGLSGITIRDADELGTLTKSSYRLGTLTKSYCTPYHRSLKTGCQ